MTALLGLECNGVLFEQIEELSERFYQMALSRIGSWLIPDMPPGISLATFNPTQRWVKQRIYEPHIKGTLPPQHYYMTALPADNAFVTAEQQLLWADLDSRYRRQYIEGDWSRQDDTTDRWAWAYDPQRHGGSPELDPQLPVYLSFDFNRNPISCSVIQQLRGEIRVLETIKLPHSNIHALCQHILVRYGQRQYIVTGDATGNAMSALVNDDSSYYKIIMKELNVSRNRIQVPTVNPALKQNQLLVNLLLERGQVRIHSQLAAALHYDLDNVKMLADGSIKKTSRTDPKQQADALDTFRYFCNMFAQDGYRY
jgi:hypothetical protein